MTSSPTNPPVSVCLTFDHLGSALDIRLGRASRPDPQRIDLVDGFPRLLDLLDDIAAPGTFYCEGWSALHHPEAVQALLARGHEIGLHGWVHERWTELTRPERERVLHDSVAAMRRAGVEQPGFRAPGGLLVGDVDGDGGDDALLEQVGITEDSSIRPGGAEHAPTIVGTTGLVNVPFVWPAVDFWCYELNPDDPATTDDLPDRWWALLEAARRRPDRLLVLDMHPGCSGTPEARFRAIEKVIRRYAAEPDVQFRTVGSVAAQVRRAAGVPAPVPRAVAAGPAWFAVPDVPPGPPRQDEDAVGWRTYLAARGLAEPDAGPCAVLRGGVSGVVVRVGDVVVKRPRRRLDVPDDWHAGTTRAIAEATALRLAGPLAPQLLHVDEQRHLLVERFAAGRSWKEELLAGVVDLVVADRVADALGHIRTLPVAGLDGADRFRRLRLSPYFGAAARERPDLAPALDEVTERLAKTRTALVHGDFSPKNIVVDRRGSAPRVVVLDWEVVNVGDPTFDLAFVLSHVIAKSLHRPSAAADLRAAAARLRSADPEADEEWLRSLTGALLVARACGKSRLEYLDAAETTQLAELGRSLLARGEWLDAEGRFW